MRFPTNHPSQLRMPHQIIIAGASLLLVLLIFFPILASGDPLFDAQSPGDLSVYVDQFGVGYSYDIFSQANTESFNPDTVITDQPPNTTIQRVFPLASSATVSDNLSASTVLSTAKSTFSGTISLNSISGAASSMATGTRGLPVCGSGPCIGFAFTSANCCLTAFDTLTLHGPTGTPLNFRVSTTLNSNFSSTPQGPQGQNANAGALANIFAIDFPAGGGTASISLQSTTQHGSYPVINGVPTGPTGGSPIMPISGQFSGMAGDKILLIGNLQLFSDANTDLPNFSASVSASLSQLQIQSLASGAFFATASGQNYGGTGGTLIPPPGVIDPAVVAGGLPSAGQLRDSQIPIVVNNILRGLDSTTQSILNQAMNGFPADASAQALKDADRLTRYNILTQLLGFTASVGTTVLLGGTITASSVALPLVALGIGIAATVNDNNALLNLIDHEATYIGAIKDLQFGNPVGPLLAIVGLLYSNQVAALRAFSQTDPPDPNYQQLALPQFNLLPQVTLQNLSTQLTLALNALLTTENNILAYLTAEMTSMNRYSSAMTVQDYTSAVLQLEAISVYLNSYAQQRGMLSQELFNLADELRREGYTNTFFDPTAFAAFQQSLHNTGFPAELVALLEQEGFTSDEITAMLNSIVALDTSTFPGFGSIVALDIAGQDLGPLGALPEPSSWVLFASGLAVLALWKRRQSIINSRNRLAQP